MSKKHIRSSQQWTIIGGPQAGTITALVIGQDDGYTLFIGTNVGLFRSMGFDGKWVQGWERLSTAPVGIMCLAVSPDYSADHTMIAGTSSGIFLTNDSGNTWQAAQIPMSSSMILTICFSPNYLSDGIIMAGTMEDGIFYSDTRGERWVSKSFGLLDPTVYSLAISPTLARDETMYAGTDTAIYYSYNNARAWRQLNIPEGAAPVLSLAISQNKSSDHTLYVGTEKQGLYRTDNQGQSWKKLDLPAACVNSLTISQKGNTLLAATEAGIYRSQDKGHTWEYLINLPGVISMVMKDEIVMAGLVDQGVWMTTDLVDWKPISNLSARSLLGLVLSSQFKTDHIAYMYGFQEGIWRTEDGGYTWNNLESLPSLDIQAVVLSPEFPDNRTIVATSLYGVLLSEDSGDSWQFLVEGPAESASFSPNGEVLTISFPGEGIRVSNDLGKTWQNVPGPWDTGGRILALSVTNMHHYYVALLEGVGETVSIWQGKPGQFEKVLNQSVSGNPVVSLWIPGPAADRPWYASLGNKVWKFSSRRGGSSVQSSIFSDTLQKENILALNGIRDQTGQILFACTGQHIYKSLDEKSWTMVHDFGNERAISLALSPSYLEDKTAYALLLGGSFSQGVIR